MKTICKKILTAVLAGCLLLSLVACSGGNSGSKAPASTEAPTKAAAALSRYDYVADMQGNSVAITIAQNLKSVKLGIAAMGLDITAYCTVEGNTLTLTELAEGNEQFYKGLAAAPFTLNEDGTAVQVSAAEPTEAAASTEAAAASAGLSRYDYVADMQGNSVAITIATNLKSVKLGIAAMGLDITAYCTVEGNTLTLTELAEGNEQFYKGLAAAPFTLNEDGTATQMTAE